MAPPTVPLTWRNVTAPDGSGAINAFNRAGENLGGAFESLGGFIKTGAQDYADAQTADFLNDLNAERDPARRQAMIDASQAFLDMEQVNAAQKANRVEDRAVSAEQRAVDAANRAQQTFANTLETYKYNVSRRGVKEERDEAAHRILLQNQQIKVQEANRKALKAWEERNVANALLGRPLTPKPKLITFDNLVSPGAPAKAPDAKTVQASLTNSEVSSAPVVSNDEKILTASVAKIENDTSENLSEFNDVQRRAIEEGRITPEELRKNIRINQIANRLMREGEIDANVPRDVAEAAFSKAQELSSKPTVSAPVVRASATIDSPLPSSSESYAAEENRIVSNAIFAESGNRGAIPSDDPKSTAWGRFQVIDANLITPPFGIKPQQAGESKKAAKERIGEAMVRGAYRKYGGDISKTAASHRFGDGVASQWDGNPETLEAAVRQYSGLSSAKIAKALKEWPDYLGKWTEGFDPGSATVQTALASSASTEKTSIPAPPVANVNIFKDISALSSNVNYPVIQSERTKAIQERAKWAILDKNQLTPEELATKTPIELRKIWMNAQKDMPNQLPSDEGSKALLDAIKRAGVDVSTISSQKAARDATVFMAKQTFTRRIENPDFDVLNANSAAISKNTGIPVAEIDALLAPKQVPALLDAFINKMRSDEKFGTSDEFGRFTIDPDSGVQVYNEQIKAFKKQYSHISNSQWSELETDAKDLLGIKTAITAAKLKKDNARKLEDKRIAHITNLRDKRAALSKTHSIESVYEKFPDLQQDKIDEAVTMLRKGIVFPNIGKGKGSIEMKDMDKPWILYEAMKLIGRVDEDLITFDDFETGTNIFGDRTDKDIIADIQKVVNTLAKQYSRPSGKTSIGGQSITLLGSVLDLPPYEKS